MPTEFPAYVHDVQIVKKLTDNKLIPFIVTHEKHKPSESPCWCTRSCGMELVIYSSGSGIMRTASTINHMHRGSICLTPPKVITQHIVQEKNSTSYWNFIFLESKLTAGDINLAESEKYQRLLRFQGSGRDRISPVYCLDNALMNEIDSIANDILSAQTFRTPNWRTFCTTACLYLLGRVFNECRSDHSSFYSVENRIERAARYIEQNCSRSLNLEALAQTAGFSPSSLSHHFKRLKGVPPIEYAITCRLQKALYMFSYCHDIGQISSECGFVEQSYFSRTFHKRLGITPRQFKNMSAEERMMYTVKLKLDNSRRPNC